MSYPKLRFFLCSRTKKQPKKRPKLLLTKKRKIFRSTKEQQTETDRERERERERERDGLNSMVLCSYDHIVVHQKYSENNISCIKEGFQMDYHLTSTSSGK